MARAHDNRRVAVNDPPHNPVLLGTAVAGLTARQQHVLAVVGRSDSLGESAAALGMHTSALSTKLRAIAHRLDLSGPSELVALARRKEILDSSQLAIYGIDQQGRCVFANSAGADLLGYDRDQLVGSDLHTLAHNRDLGGSPLPLQECGARQVAAGTITSHSARAVLWHANGQPRWVDYRAVAVGETDDARMALVTVADMTPLVQAEWQQSLHEARLQLTLEATSVTAFQVDLRSERITGWGDVLTLPEGMSYDDFLATVDPRDRQKVAIGTLRRLRAGSFSEDEIRLTGPSGEQRIMRCRAKVVADISGQAAVLLGVAIDITDERSQECLRSAFRDASPDAYVSADPLGTVVEWNRAAATIFGFDQDAAMGRPMEELILASRYRQEYRRSIDELVTSSMDGAVVHGPIEIPGQRADGKEIPVEAIFALIPSPAGVGVQAVLRDISSRKASEARLLEYAVSDQMTGLANRALLHDRLVQGLSRLRRSPGTLSLLFVDLDRFKRINESIGHEAGDSVLREVARRISAVLRPGDTAARFGSDQFVILCHDLADHEALQAARLMLSTLEPPVRAGGYDLAVTASIGVSHTDDPEADPGHLLRDADAAMWRAKQHGSARAEIFNPKIGERALARLETEAELRHALQTGQLKLFYQPVVDTTTERIRAVEALVRWDHPRRGLLAPGSFLPVAEETGLIVDLGTWVLQTACTDLSAWPGSEHLHLSVNLSGRQLAGPDVVETVSEALNRSGLAAHRLGLELTETVLTDDSAAVVTTLERLDQVGVKLALDDFGTGHSSLVRLRRFPISVLKLDKQFVAGLGHSSDDTAIVKASIDLARALGMTVIAEGVERPDQLEILRSMGCESAQGHLWSPAIPGAELAALVRAEKSLAAPVTRPAQPSGRG